MPPPPPNTHQPSPPPPNGRKPPTRNTPPTPGRESFPPRRITFHIIPHHSASSPPATVIPAKAGIHPRPVEPPGFAAAILSTPRRRHPANTAIPAPLIRHSRPPPSFRRRPESRTPVSSGVAKGRGVDSRFRGNDGGAAGMTGWGRPGVGGGGNDYGCLGIGASPEKAPRRKPRKSPPFAKGGLGGFYTYTYTPPRTANNRLLWRTPLAGGRVDGDAARCSAAWRVNPSNPPKIKGPASSPPPSWRSALCGPAAYSPAPAFTSMPAIPSMIFSSAEWSDSASPWFTSVPSICCTRAVTGSGTFSSWPVCSTFRRSF